MRAEGLQPFVRVGFDINVKGIAAAFVAEDAHGAFAIKQAWDTPRRRLFRELERNGIEMTICERCTDKYYIYAVKFEISDFKYPHEFIEPRLRKWFRIYAKDIRWYQRNLYKPCYMRQRVVKALKRDLGWSSRLIKSCVEPHAVKFMEIGYACRSVGYYCVRELLERLRREYGLSRWLPLQYAEELLWREALFAGG